MDEMGVLQLLFVYARQVMDTLLASVNLNAVWLGVAAEQGWAYVTPRKEGMGPFSTKAGHIMSRLLPLVCPFVAVVATVVLEWDGKFAAVDVVRGLLSAFFSGMTLRIYYKMVKGL